MSWSVTCTNNSFTDNDVTYYWLDLFEHPMVVQQTDSVSSNESTKRISSNTELRDSVALFLQLLKPSLDLIRNALAAKLNAIVGETTRVALRYKNVKIGESLSNAGG